MKKKILLSLLLVTFFATSLFAAAPENALISRPEESVYAVLKLEDTGDFLRWIIADDNVKPFLPLIQKSQYSADILGGLDVAKVFAATTPLKSAALIVGAPRPEKGKKTSEQFFQAAFTVTDEFSSTVKKIADGTAKDSDFATLVTGNSPLSAMLATMIKPEKLDGNVYRVDTGLFVKAEDGVILISENPDELKAMTGGEKLFSKVKRKFDDKDFLFVHADYETLDALNDDDKLDEASDKIKEYIDKPLELEMAFKSVPEKFVVSTFLNVHGALKDGIIDKSNPVTPVKGSFIKPSGTKTPLLAFGGYLTLPALKTQNDTKEIWSSIVKSVQRYFGLSEEDVASLFTGPTSLTVNDNVNFEIMKVPAVYISQTGKAGAAEKVFEKLTKSKYLHKVQDGVLQLDTSISPVSCLVNADGDSLGIRFVDASSSSSSTKPVIKPLFGELLDAKGISALWIDFDAARSWIMDADNGVFAMLLPMSKMMGFGPIVDAAQDVLSAELSVPSVSFRAEDVETFRVEFATEKINPENGLMNKLVKLYLKLEAMK